MWDKPKFNFLIDILMFLCMSAMAGIGFLMNYILLPGREAVVEYGRGVELLFWGMNRHDWGDIHLYLGFTLIGLLILHIILHWNLIPGLYQRLVKNRTARTIGAWALVIVCLVFLFFPFAITPEVQQLAPGQGRGQELHDTSLEIRGSMTLQDVSRQYNIPISVMKEQLNLPASVPDTARLGRLRRFYRFNMSDVERLIQKHRNSGQ